MFSERLAIVLIALLVELMTSSACFVLRLFFFTSSWIFEVEETVCAASAFTSFATTLKPRPASPAWAASIAALSARTFVFSAMSLIRSIACVISSVI